MISLQIKMFNRIELLIKIVLNTEIKYKYNQNAVLSEIYSNEILCCRHKKRNEKWCVDEFSPIKFAIIMVQWHYNYSNCYQ